MTTLPIVRSCAFAMWMPSPFHCVTSISPMYPVQPLASLTASVAGELGEIVTDTDCRFTAPGQVHVLSSSWMLPVVGPEPGPVGGVGVVVVTVVPVEPFFLVVVVVSTVVVATVVVASVVVVPPSVVVPPCSARRLQWFPWCGMQVSAGDGAAP